MLVGLILVNSVGYVILCPSLTGCDFFWILICALGYCLLVDYCEVDVLGVCCGFIWFV